MTTPEPTPDPALRALLGVLGDQAEALRTLIYRLTVASLLVADGSDRYVARAGDDVVAAADRIGELDLARAVVTMDLAAAWDMATDQPTLREISAAAPADYRAVLDSHLTELRSLATEAAELAAVGSELAEVAGARVSEAVTRLETLGTGAAYDSSGSSESPPSSAFFDGTA